MLINLTAVLTERDPDKNLPINIRAGKNQQSSFVFLAFTPSQMNITIKYRLSMRASRLQGCSKLVQTLLIQDLDAIRMPCHSCCLTLLATAFVSRVR